MTKQKQKGSKHKTSAPRVKLVQVSKEYVGGKWQRVGFYENKKGEVVAVKPIPVK